MPVKKAIEDSIESENEISVACAVYAAHKEEKLDW
jgi:hypothetical protein